MNSSQWETIKKCANLEEQDRTPVGLIVDSPWIPQYAGISTLDYFTMPERWLEANLQVVDDFPEVIFLPGFWVEFGMANEPSGFGCKINFFENNTPTIIHLTSSPEEAGQLKPPNPRKDGLMPLVLNWYKNMEPRVNEAGQLIKIVAARGPLAIATHLMGLTDFLIGLKTEPDLTHQLLKTTALTVKFWLQAQAEVLSEVEGILVLDDIVGFLSKDDYLEFAHPYLKEIFGAFPGCVKIFHNDTDNPVPYEFIGDLGINLFNFTHLRKISQVRELTGNNVCLMGNVPPLEILTKGTPDQVKTEARHCLLQNGGKSGLLLSAGGGTSPQTPRENIQALVEAVKTVY